MNHAAELVLQVLEADRQAAQCCCKPTDEGQSTRQAIRAGAIRIASATSGAGFTSLAQNIRGLRLSENVLSVDSGAI
jgi:hypothetical protein